MPARYHLRFQIQPSADTAADATALAKFCTTAGVDEVVLLLAAEELHPGHPAGAEEDTWFETVTIAGDLLRAAGLEVSLNPWVTVGHADRGRLDTLGFHPMVSPLGETATAQASFACPRWRSWITAHYGRFAELGFRVLWLEDDFRYHNHAPLHWGGGFEPLMLQRLAELTGEPATREQVVAAFTAPGPPHPWRAMLQQVWRTAQLEVAQLLAQEVGLRSGGRSQLGLMSSRLGEASVEGRDWEALFRTLSVNGRTVQRPHFAPYSDAAGRELSFSVWSLELQRALRPPYATSEPEVENWPHTAWSKSDTQTWSELVAAQLAGSDALLLNVHPMHGRRADRFPQVGELLRRSRPALDRIAERPPHGLTTHGIGLPFRQDTAAHVHSTGPELGSLAADPGPAADFLLRYGVPVTAAAAPVQALFGQNARAFDDSQLRAMLTGGLLLDGVAAAVLTERGFGHLIGARVEQVVAREQQAEPGPYAAERVVSAAHEPGTLLSVNTQPALARVEPLPGAQLWTEVVTPSGEYWGAGRCGYTNELGGRVVVLAATAPDALPFDDDGQRLLHAIVRYLEGDRPRLPLVSGGPHLIPQLAQIGGVRRLAVANGSADPALVRVDLPGDSELVHDNGTGSESGLSATLLLPLEQPTTTGVSAAGCRIDVNRPLPHRGWLILEW